MFNLVLLLVKLAFPEQVVDRLIVLRCFPVSVNRRDCKRGTFTISKNCPSMLYSQPLLFSASAALNTSLTARGIIPTVASVYRDLLTNGRVAQDGLTEPPSMVKDLPEPVWPYAKIQTLYPSTQLCARSEISSKTSPCVDSGSNTCTQL